MPILAYISGLFTIEVILLMTEERADKLLVTLGHARSRTLAQRMIEAGHVEVLQAGLFLKVKKTSVKLATDAQFRIVLGKEQRFVSRAGLKLEGALEKVALNVDGLHALDVGQSTGGFTDCLLQKGCVSVVGVDVGHDQLDKTLREDPRVMCLEGINARKIKPALFQRQFDVVVMDVSFISQTLILPQLAPLLLPSGHLLSLVKPQFEVGSEGIAKGGLVKDVSLYEHVQQKIGHCLRTEGFDVLNFFESSIQGGDGNREFFVHAKIP